MAAAGLLAGVMTSTVGVASLVSFPVLVALGIPPVVANASNTVGLTPAGLTGSFGYRRELAECRSATRTVMLTSSVGAIAGAFLLLALPAAVFTAIVPWLILGTCALVGAQPWLKRKFSGLRDGPPLGAVRLGPSTTVFATITGVYGGYFGAGSGVMMMAVLGLGSELEFRSINALKTLSVMASNVVATVVFLCVADLDWRATLLLAAGSVVGGYVGARIGRRLNPNALRALIVVIGVAAAASMLV